MRFRQQTQRPHLLMTDFEQLARRTSAPSGSMIPDGDDHCAMRFPGRRSRNRIAFKCEVETNPPGEKTELGPACFQSIAVTRVNTHQWRFSGRPSL
jgi:hypothetical protein